MYDMKQVITNYKILAGQVKSELDIQFDDGRIKGTEYADVFNKLMMQAMAFAFESPIKDQELLQKTEQVRLTAAQAEDQEFVTEYIRPIELTELQCKVELCNAQTELVQAQAEDQKFVTQIIRPTEQQIKMKELDIKTSQAQIALREVDIKEQELQIKRIELDIARERLELARHDAAYKEAQIRLTNRQIKGFDDNKAQKLFDAQMNAWAMMFSSGLLTEVPAIITGDKASQLYCKMAAEIGVHC
jgi:hypothetical protein